MMLMPVGGGGRIALNLTHHRREKTESELYFSSFITLNLKDSDNCGLPPLDGATCLDTADPPEETDDLCWVDGHSLKL